MWLLEFLAGMMAGAMLPLIRDWWQRNTRGEYHCKVCGQISPLPKDDT